MKSTWTLRLSLISGFVLLTTAKLHLKDGDRCKLSKGIAGVCRRVSDCPSAAEQLRANVGLHQPCSSSRGEQAVCCAAREYAELGKNQRISDRACQVYRRGSAHLSDFPLSSAFPHMAALRYNNTEEERCGGTLISDQYVLTSARCVTDPKLKTPTLVRLGIMDIETPYSRGDFVIKPEDIIVHPDYHQRFQYDDIALIRLPSRVVFSPQIFPACLFSKSDTPKQLKITGWGATQVNGSNPSRLLMVAVVPSTGPKKCWEGLRPEERSKLPIGLRDTLVCTDDDKVNAGTCRGDAGGPIQVHEDPNNTVYSIVGVIIARHEPCDGKSLYTRVSSYLDWIESVVWRSPHYS